MADIRFSTHQQFDMMRCKLCNNMYEAPRLLHCLHSFCSTCLKKHATNTMSPSDDHIVCPLCQEVTSLPTGGVEELMKNTPIERYLLQAQRDQTKRVAGREVLQMTRQAFSEADLQSPDIIASIQHIADTAGTVLANEVAEQSKIHNFETLKTRQSLQAKTTLIQENALEIVYSIDQVNQGMEDWLDKKNQLREKIKQRSKEIQDTIRGIERKLISQLEDRDVETQMKNEAFSVKSKLHKTLRGSLTMVDFLRLLTEYGDQSELETFASFVKEREEKLLKDHIRIQQTTYTFDHPRVDLEEELQTLLGTFSEITDESTVWDPKQKSKRLVDSHHESNPGSDEESHSSNVQEDVRAEPYLMTRYMEVNENGQLVERGVDDSEYSTKYAKRFESTQPQKHRRRPMKSMSFDAGMGYNPNPHQPITTSSSEHKYRPENNEYHHHTAKHQALNKDEHHNVAVDTGENNNTDTDENSDTEKNSLSSSHTVSSAIESLARSSDHGQYLGQRSWSRRVSAPSSMIINTLSQRRLSALSILERANINTQGLNMTSDVESGMNDARLEWLRDNIRRKAQNERRASVQEEV